MQEQRKSMRFNKRLEAVLFTADKDKKIKYEGTTLDISIDGASFISQYHILSANPATVYLLLEKGNASRASTVFEAQCRIVCSVLSRQQGGFRHGLQYTQVSSENKQIMQKFIAPLMAHAGAKPLPNT